MDIVYYLSMILLSVVIFILPITLLAIVVKPYLLNKRMKQQFSRGKIFGIGLASILVATFMLSAVMAATEPASVRQEREKAELQSKQQKEKDAKLQVEKVKKAREAELSKPKITIVVEKQAIPFPVEEKEDTNLPKGQTKIVQIGQNGEQTTNYEITTVKGVETARIVKSQAVSVQSIAQITAVGTYVAPAPAASSSSTGGGYMNSAGSHIPSPSSSPAGASAQCADGTYSYSQSRRGTCSHHGGVATWL